MGDLVVWRLDNTSHLLVSAFISRFPGPMSEASTPAQIATLLRDPSAHCELPTPDDKLRASVRDALRKHGFKPTGRSKPSSEYLSRAQVEGGLRSINAAVDTGNALSLRSGLPVSVIDLDLSAGPLSVRNAEAGESYVFNPTGQVLQLAGLPCLFDAAGPCANAVKDAQRTKTSANTRSTLSVVWSCRGLEALTGLLMRVYHEAVSAFATVEAIELVEHA